MLCFLWDRLTGVTNTTLNVNSKKNQKPAHMESAPADTLHTDMKPFLQNCKAWLYFYRNIKAEHNWKILPVFIKCHRGRYSLGISREMRGSGSQEHVNLGHPTPKTPPLEHQP